MIRGKLLTDDVRGLARGWLEGWVDDAAKGSKLSLGLPEWDGRLARWRVALVADGAPGQPVGEIQIDAGGTICRAPTPTMLAERLRQLRENRRPHRAGGKARIAFPPVPNKAVLGDVAPCLPSFRRTARSWRSPRHLTSMPSRSARSRLIIGRTWSFWARRLMMRW